jgi:hypothetical protein
MGEIRNGFPKNMVSQAFLVRRGMYVWLEIRALGRPMNKRAMEGDEIGRGIACLMARQFHCFTSISNPFAQHDTTLASFFHHVLPLFRITICVRCVDQV